MNELIESFSYDLFHYENSKYLYLILIVLAFALFEFFPGRKFDFSISKLKKFIDSNLIPHLLQGSENKTKNLIKAIYIFTICILLILALANPRWSFEEVESYKANVNVIFAVDLSRSMDAEDEKPSRIERVKQEINDILDNVSGANFGIIGFANQAHIISPITQDKETIRHFTDTLSPDLVSFQGSNIETAIEQANFMFQGVGNGINYLIIMSDGDFDTNQNMVSFRVKLKDAKLISYGFGTNEGAPIKQSDGGFIKYNGKIVISKYNGDNLKNLSGEAGYIKSSYLDEDIEYLKNMIDKKVAAQTQKYQTMQIWDDRFYIPLTIAMVMLLPFFRKGSVFPMVFLMFVFSYPAAAKEEKKEDVFEFLKFDNLKENFLNKNIFLNSDQKGLSDFEERNYEGALEKFSDNYNKGVAAYRNKDFTKAEELFKNSIKNEDDINAVYNLGNSQLMQLKAEEAIESYKKVLKKDEDHEDAKHNLEIAKRLLEKQKQDKNNQKKNQEKSQNKDQQDQQDQGDGQDDQDQQNEKSQGDQGRQNDQDQQNGRSDQGNEKENEGSDEKQGNEGGGKPEEEREDNENREDKSGQNPDKKAGDQGGKDNLSGQQTSGKNQQSELDSEANKMFEQLSSDTDEFMMNRFKYEETGNPAIGAQEQEVKPW